MVIDASATLDLLLITPGRHDLAQLVQSAHLLHAPQLIEPEILQALRRSLRRKKIDDKRANEFLQDFSEFPLVRHRHESLRNEIWKLRFQFSAYDATYVALAKTLGVPLITTDIRLARSASKIIDIANSSYAAEELDGIRQGQDPVSGSVSELIKEGRTK